ncbi:luciferase family protein [Mycobacterium bohemicum DSM 44277]|uniref:Luciferase family protein n=1 Tax=Mycobacterium bohemicum DSM 44277 TaxID=1236609 RepID=A0A0U0W430_MYCBE|nr:TIGR03619 family F420-dependent LLM class oxidoreductase [Mycobacterium bohemicum]CPR08656.1 luciferase family protein [Mycobacterium bohemicum DSM 44277]
MKVSVVAPVADGVTADPQWMVSFARHLEACGFESIIVAEHTVLATSYDSVYPYDKSGRVGMAADCPIPDPLDVLAFLAAHTGRLGLATGVLVLPNHHPVVLAKRAATVDVLSGGRLRLCVGVGWLREEVEACGADFATRGRRADEQLAVLRTLWADRPEGASHHGEFFDFDGVMSYPKPVAGERLPVHIGGHSPAAARRAGRLAASEVRRDAVALGDGRVVPGAVTVWTAGFAVPDLAARSGLTTDAVGRLITDETLTSIDDDRIVAAGDAAAPSGRPLRMSCQAAGPLGAQAANTVLSRIAGRTPAAVNQAFIGQCISLGRSGAAIQLSHTDDTPINLVMGGRLATSLKEAICKATLWSIRREAAKPGSYRWLKGGKRPARMQASRQVVSR